MSITRRNVLAAGVIGAAAVPVSYAMTRDGGPKDVEAGQEWNAGSVQHLLPVASDTRFLIKTSLLAPLAGTLALRVDEQVHVAEQRDSDGEFFTFDIKGLEPDTAYDLQIMSDGHALTDAWPLRTFPARHASPESMRLLCYSCAGGPDIFFRHQSRPIFSSFQNPQTPARPSALVRTRCSHPVKSPATTDP